MKQFYATVGSNDVKRAEAFYTELLTLLGWKKIMPHDGGGAYFGNPSTAPDTGVFGVVRPYNGQDASLGNGCMVGFAFETNDEVDNFYAKAMELGAKDEGAPGFRGPKSLGAYYSYFRDLDGNKITAYRWKRNEVVSQMLDSIATK